MLEKIADAQKAGRHVDGHGAGLNPEQLAVYRAVGIDTDHEAHSTEMALERLNAGMRVFIREGTVERDELAILPAVTSSNAERFAFCTDDKNVTDLLLEGSIDYNVNLAVSKGLAMETALKMASYGAAQAHHLQNVGALAAGYVADLVVFDSLQHFSAQEVMVAGQWVTEKQTTKPLAFAPQAINIKPQLSDFELPLINGVAHVIGIEPNHITTTHLIEEVPQNTTGKFVANQTYAKIAVFERYHQLGYGLGIIKGFKLRGGAIAATVAHDSHNLIVAGHNDSAMYTAANHLRELGGGMVVVEDDGTITSLPLPIAGLMSDQPYSLVAEQVTTLMAAFKRISTVEFDPFLTLSFMALPVIPSLKITDQGLFDFEKFTFININAQ
ncbi:adenine deaminase [Weissella oryzae SG25]|uniref:Adenine deaminase n=1 Tax=Weissella oryzae (strain DSM 25784 / JCM 18191 / LMG 30913 / SG25) TaxID=1329250 RepID=A0A069CV81_WEIOS|nr:adenine deaminase [Weissella oryzae SG25]